VLIFKFYVCQISDSIITVFDTYTLLKSKWLFNWGKQKWNKPGSKHYYATAINAYRIWCSSYYRKSESIICCVCSLWDRKQWAKSLKNIWLLRADHRDMIFSMRGCFPPKGLVVFTPKKSHFLCWHCQFKCMLWVMRQMSAMNRAETINTLWGRSF
jgi:hypothetical protein